MHAAPATSATSKRRRQRLLFALGLLALTSGAAPAAPRPPVYRVYAIRYATVPKFPVRYLVTGADTTRGLPSNSNPMHAPTMSTIESTAPTS